MNKCGILASAALLVLTACGGGSKSQPGLTQSAAGMHIVLQSPSLGTVGVPIPIAASASSPNGVSGWIVYADDRAVVTLNNSSDSLSTSVPLSSGEHTVYVRVWDRGGENFVTSPSLRINVEGKQAAVSVADPTSNSSPAPATASSAPPPASEPAGPLPAVPGNAKVWSAIQNMGGWQSCSDCAGGGATTGNYWSAANQSSPSMSGSSREFYVGGKAWSNALWYNKVGSGYSWAWHFLWDFWVRFDSTSAAHAHSAEYDIWQVIGGREYMMGTQCNFETGVWDVWDSKNFQWKPTGIGCPRFSADQWHHIQWYIERQGSNYHYGVLVVDGNAHFLDRTYTTDPVGRDDSVGVQFQLDENGSGTPLHEWVDNVKLAIW